MLMEWLIFAMLAARIQMHAGRGFYFEHPRHASSWEREGVCAVFLASDSDVPSQCRKAHFDECAVGLVAPNGKPMKKGNDSDDKC